MSYEDALDDCLSRLEAGEELESVLARYPGDAARLREDIDLALSLNRVLPALPERPGSSERGWANLQSRLRDLRDQRPPAVPVARRPFPFGGFSPLTRGLAGALALTVVAAVALMVATATGGPNLVQPVRSLVGSSAAEAASFDGVVVDNAGDLLTVQTSSGLKSVSVPATAAIADSGGAPVSLPDLTTGQLISVKGKRLDDGTVAAARIDRQNLAALEAWCAAHSDQCQQLRERLEGLLASCHAQGRPACQDIESRVGVLRERLRAIGAQVEELNNRCQHGRALACRELKRVCQLHKDLCRAASDRPPLPKPVPGPKN